MYHKAPAVKTLMCYVSSVDIPGACVYNLIDEPMRRKTSQSIHQRQFPIFGAMVCWCAYSPLMVIWTSKNGNFNNFFDLFLINNTSLDHFNISA